MPTYSTTFTPCQLRFPAVAFCALAAISTASAQTETILHNFIVPTGYVSSSLASDGLGSLYGTTTEGGEFAKGLVFKLDFSGHYTVVHAFSGPPDGARSAAGLVRDAGGNLIGTTAEGGASDCGTVFKVDPSGQETVLYSFRCAEGGKNPATRVTLDAVGNIYGTLELGGSSNLGLVYRIEPNGHFTFLHSFVGGADGASPFGEPVLDPAGNLYGTTLNGGTYNRGVVYKIDPSRQESVLYSFTGGTDGAFPQGGLIRDAVGNLYGIAMEGGLYPHHGVVFKLDSSGHETAIHSFAGSPTDGTLPESTLTADSSGNLFGTTSYGGAFGDGAVFEINAATHQESLVFSFNGTDGNLSYGPLLIYNGKIYGTTVEGGPSGIGVIFQITP